MTRQAYALLGITAVAAIVRFATLDHQSSITTRPSPHRVLHPGLFDTLSAVVHLERSPPLYYLLAWRWSKLFGTARSAFARCRRCSGRSPCRLAYWRPAGARLAPHRLVVRRAVALNPYLIWYSQEARSYALMACSWR